MHFAYNLQKQLIDKINYYFWERNTIFINGIKNYLTDIFDFILILFDHNESNFIDIFNFIR